ncbi:MAG: ABC transporter permease [Chloroflexi bacterium]|nr:ABC transporter permease [Chloroflexota bacterium]
MARFLIRRVFYMAAVMVGISMIVFGLSRLTGDPRLLYMTQGTRWSQEVWDARGRELGLDKPMVVQYLVWAGNAIQGDFGDSLWHKRNSLRIIIEKLPATLQLSGISYLMAVALGVILGTISAVTRGTLIDIAVRSFALIGQAAPPFWLALILIFFFAVYLDILPTSRRGDWTHFVLPATTLAWLGSAGLARLTRSSLLEVLDSEYIKLARAKGVSTNKVVLKHALKNALIAPLTVAAILLASFLSGTVVVETVFAWPGLGRLAVDATKNNDFPLITGITVIFAGLFLLSSLLADLLYAYIDPRIRIYDS